MLLLSLFRYQDLNQINTSDRLDWTDQAADTPDTFTHILFHFLPPLFHIISLSESLEREDSIINHERRGGVHFIFTSRLFIFIFISTKYPPSHHP